MYEKKQGQHLKHTNHSFNKNFKINVILGYKKIHQKEYLSKDSATIITSPTVFIIF
jgi:hypothetical protein